MICLKMPCLFVHSLASCLSAIQVVLIVRSRLESSLPCLTHSYPHFLAPSLISVVVNLSLPIPSFHVRYNCLALEVPVPARILVSCSPHRPPSCLSLFLLHLCSLRVH
ncbi:hypothetical protein GSI_07287 [Ganoderma sinense ZZ0214-1]|uniref:Transporter n=1 Tax=Ganoderma sinense ZZ0214-1 TaxID=1077348 RepID=A0A2G8S9Y8_9APHY|nr:hypothetical protein GSI_07287 [Ganoderma sinense ZZ0214-1]